MNQGGRLIDRLESSVADRRSVLVGSIAGLSAAALPSLASAMSPSPKHKGFVFGLGPAGRCDDYRTGIPLTVFDESTQSYKMWYYCRSSEFPADMAPTLSSGRVAYAVSPDGISWTRVDGDQGKGAVFGPSEDPEAFDGGHVGSTDVVYAHGQYWMAYFGGNHVVARTKFGEIPGLAMLPGLARSTDGLNWTRVSGSGPRGSLFDVQEGDIFASWVNIAWSGHRLYLWYTGASSDFASIRSYLAVSGDYGHSWDQKGEVLIGAPTLPFDGGGMMTRHAMRDPFSEKERWFMLYTAMDGRSELSLKRSIGVAVSEDGLAWEREVAGPILEASAEGLWDSGGVAAPRLVLTAKKMDLFYIGMPLQSADDGLPKGIGLARSRLGDFHGFERVDV